MKNTHQFYPGFTDVNYAVNPSAIKYKVLIDQSVNAFFVSKLDGTVMESNTAASKMFGYSATEFLSITRQQLIDHKANNVWQTIKQHKKNIPVKFEATAIKKNGDKFPVEIFSVVFTDADGELRNSAMVTDITGRVSLKQDNAVEDSPSKKDAALLLQNSVESYRYLFNNNPASIIIWNLDSLKIIEVNDSAIELYGFSRKEFLQLTILDLRGPEDHTAFLQVLKQVKEIGMIKQTMRWQHLTKKGAKILVEITSHPLIYNNEKAVLAMGTDVTEKVQLENSLLEERKRRHQQITDAVIAGQEKERIEIGQELHDNINQILATTKLFLECALAQKTFRRKLVNDSKELTEKAMREIRNLSNALLPPSLEEIGLLEALNDLVETVRLANPLKLITQWDNFTEFSLDKN